MARIHYYVHGRGRGHATRSMAVAARLEADGHTVTMFAGADARELLAHRWPVHAVRSLPARASLRVIPALAVRVRAAARAARRGGAELLISDGDLPGLLGARACGVPTIAIGRGLVFARCRRPAGVPRLRWWREGVRAWLSTAPASAHIAVSFAPVRARSRATIVARPCVDLPPREPSDGHVLCYFRDGDPGLAGELARRGLRVERFGPGAQPPRRAPFVASLRRARAVVASAGSQLIAECATVGAPLFAVYARSDDEQAINVALLRAGGLGEGAAADDPRLVEKLLAFLGARPRFRAPGWSAPDVADATAHTARVLLTAASRPTGGC